MHEIKGLLRARLVPFPTAYHVSSQFGNCNLIYVWSSVDERPGPPLYKGTIAKEI